MKRALTSLVLLGAVLGFCAFLGSYRRAMVTLPRYEREPY